MKALSLHWNVTPYLKNFGDIEKEQKRIQTALKAFIKRWKNNNEYLQNEQVLKAALDDYNEWAAQYQGGGITMYILELMLAKNQLDAEVKAYHTQHSLFTARISNEIMFFPLSLSTIPKPLQENFIKSPLLAPYRHFLERIFAEAPHLLSQKEEAILNLKQLPAYHNWVEMVSKFLSKEECEVVLEDGTRTKKNESELLALLKSKHENVRKSAGLAINSLCSKYAPLATEELNTILLNKKIDDELRGFTRPDESRHISDDIESSVVDTLREAVSAKNALAHEFYRLKAALLKKPTLAYYERAAPVGEFHKTYSYEEAYQLVESVMHTLSPRFAQILNSFATHGQIDVLPAKGKRGGAFCAHYLISHPTFILLNHTGTLQDVLTFAHELGHGIHNEFTREKQNALNFGTPTSTAEVASTFMEDFVLKEIMKTVSPEEELTLRMQRLEDDISAIFRQVACYNFEWDLHADFRQKGYLTMEHIGALFTKHMRAYMGPYVEQTEGSENWWVYWSHIRTYFYVYSYASGLLISKALQRKVRLDKGFIREVEAFLSAGLSASPQELFTRLGIPLNKNFWQEGLREIENDLQKTQELARSLGKI